MRPALKRLLFGAAVGLPAVALGARLWSRRASTPPMLDALGQPSLKGVASLEPVRLGGVEQWVLARGRDVRNPLLVFLAGGPGGSELPWVRHYNAVLEEHFVVVNWDQRGAAKSYDALRQREALTPEQYVSDTCELLDWLASRFGQQKAVLVGHSWGSILGVLAARRRPDRVSAYVGIGQQVNFLENDTLSYLRAHEAAERRGDTATVQQLHAMGPPPYSGDGLARQYAQLTRLAGRHAGHRSLGAEMIALMLAAPEYTLRDKVNFARGLFDTFGLVYPRLAGLNLEAQVPRLEMPVWLLLGREDWVTPSEIAARYFESLQAPRKELIWFENSGHSPCYEEPAKFNAVLIEQVRPAVEPRREERTDSVSFVAAPQPQHPSP